MHAKLVLPQNALSELQNLSGSPILLDEPMSLHTTFRLGGPADVFAAPADAKSFANCIRWAHENGIEHLVMGAGSNLLVADAGIRGMVLATSSLKKWRIDGDTLTAEVGVFMPALSKALVDEGFSGLVEACGIPGSIGGGLHMNAGAYGWNISKITKRVFAVNEAGEGLELDSEGMEFGLKTSALMKHGYIALSMQALLEKADKDVLRARASELLQDRARKQPLDVPNAGCIFRNPTGAGAGRLIDSCGLKGSRLGGAMVSTKHANFIVNVADAKSSDVRQLIDKVKREVLEKFGERLEPEVRLVGDWDEQ